jgi:hypothetical protein
MSIAPHAGEKFTVADLFARFGPMPLNRIRFTPAPGTATEDDLLSLQTQEEASLELIDECVPGFRIHPQRATRLEVARAFAFNTAIRSRPSAYCSYWPLSSAVSVPALAFEANSSSRDWKSESRRTSISRRAPSGERAPAIGSSSRSRMVGAIMPLIIIGLDGIWH